MKVIDEKGRAVTDILTIIMFVSMAVGGACGIAAMVLIFLKRDVRPAVVVFSICVLVCFSAMLLLPRS